MNEVRILNLWKQGLSKNKIAELYKREYNHEIKLIRMTVRNRHAGKYITSYEALNRIEIIIYKYLKEIHERNKSNNNL